MKKQTKKKEQNNLLISIIIVIGIIIIVAGSTYAYWSWQTSGEQKTNISVTIDPTIGTMNITGDNITSTTMRPTSNCAGSYALIGEATVTVVNKTATQMRATPRLDVKLTPVSGRTLSSTALSHLHWALVDTTSTTSKTCANPDYQGTFDKVIKTTVSGGGQQDVVTNTVLTPASVGSTAVTFDITKNISSFSTSMTESTRASNTLSFVATAGTTNAQGTTTPVTTTRKYKVYVWLDSGYEHTNTGDTVSDPMQDLSLTIKWSTKSTLIQE